MKTTKSTLIKLLILGLGLVALNGCQDEIEPEVEIGMDGIASKDPLAKAIVAVATKDGSNDNIVDRSSCTTIIFPITGIFEDEERVFASLNEVKDLGAGALEVDFIFPLSVILSDHSEVSLNSEDELEAIQGSCIEGGNDADNECIDFSYPFTIQVFDTRTENVDTREINSDAVAYTTFTSADLIITIDYPVSLRDTASKSIEAFSNEELISAISEAENTCEEQDIVEFEELFEEELRTLFASASWQVSLYEENGDENTAIFSGYTLLFNEDLTLQSQGTEMINGEWDIELLDTGESISIEFDTDDQPLILLNETWTIVEHNQTQITLEYQDNEESTKQLKLSSN